MIKTFSLGLEKHTPSDLKLLFPRAFYNYYLFLLIIFFSGCSGISGDIQGRMVPADNQDNSCILHYNEEFRATIYPNGNVLIQTNPVIEEEIINEEI